ncbi:archaea-specific SMC-related protein [Haloplanus aerogenes]|uniref:AAA domain-containing protein n=1 Tax=Haloplanus aerogenes TaxID=660522 RepID=A0A3M0CU79_9EURY|nr:archaea-specific SMC-related protein [Haloplanus aerogenes]AZH26719.1 chromosome segregation ATPase [Haloplanus aerogenes]RMB12962.1 AAA domain-containing protein [Haloplanus aerogenes]
MTHNETNGERENGDESLTLDVRNVGGIEQASVTLDPGVTIVAGENASNKSSLLGSLGGVLGGPHPPLRGGADRGSVTLAFDGDRFDLDLIRRDGETVVADATPYTTATTLVDLFVSLGEENPIRRAVVDSGDLHELLMRPVDTAAIEAEIERLQNRREEIDERIEELDATVEDLPELEVRARQLAERQADVADRLESKRAAITEADYRDAAEATQDLLDDLEAARSERDQLRDRRDTKRRAVDSLRDDLEGVDERLTDLSGEAELESVDDRIEQVDAELTRLRDRKGRLDETINALSPIVELNQQFLADARLPSTFDADGVVDDLHPGSGSITCWTCGQSVDRAEIKSQVEAVEAILQEKRRERTTVEARIEERKKERATLDARRDEYDDLVARRRQLEREIEERERTLADLDSRIDEVGKRIERLEAELAETDAADALVDRHREVSDLEYERGRLERELSDVEERIEAAEAAKAERETLREERAEVTSELAERRDRVERIERETVETVNECMARVLDRLGYRAVERVWIERREEADGTVFDLQVVRTADDGTVYRAAVDTLSKSEREVVGLVIALAGYLVYDVAETVPVVVVDAIEMLDAERIHGLLDFFDEHARYVVAAVLPEEAERLRKRFDTVELAAVEAA